MQLDPSQLREATSPDALKAGEVLHFGSGDQNLGMAKGFGAAVTNEHNAPANPGNVNAGLDFGNKPTMDFN